MKTSIRRKLRDNQAFTLIELMVVVVILGILAGMVLPKLMGRTDHAKAIKAKSDIASIETALKLYRLDHGAYPTTEQGLQALVNPSSDSGSFQKGGYLDRQPKDPWGNDYVYLCPGSHEEFDLISYGADKVAGGETGADKDINNWDF